MVGDLYDVHDDPYLYAGSGCLKNRLALQDPETLANFELEMSTLRAEEPFPLGRFSPSHYRAIHRHLFQDVYRWAGRYRTIRTGKGGNWFCYPEYIAGQMQALFQRLTQAEFQDGVDEQTFLDAATEFLADLNAIHPFREGNGRTQLAFVDMLASRAGWPLDFALVDPNTFLPAMINSFAGDTDGLRTRLDNLRA